MKLHTQGGSCLSGEAGKKGAIAIGQLSDGAAFTEDYFSIPKEEIKGIESVLTIVDGKIVCGAQEFQGLDPAPLPVLRNGHPLKSMAVMGRH